MSMNNGNILHEINNFKKIKKIPEDKIFKNSNALLSIEGSGKTYRTIKLALKKCEGIRNKTFVFSQNTIEKMYENYEEAKNIIFNDYLKNKKNKPCDLILLPSLSEFYRSFFKDKSTEIVKLLNHEIVENLDITIISLHKNNYKIIKKKELLLTTTNDKLKSSLLSNYIFQYLNFSNPNRKSIKRDTIILISKNGKNIPIEKIEYELNNYKDKSLTFKTKRIYDIIEKDISKLDNIINQDNDLSMLTIHREELNELFQKYRNINLTVKLSVRGKNTNSCMIFTQHDKLLQKIESEFNDYMIDPEFCHLIIDEMPINKFRTFSFKELSKHFTSALQKKTTEYNISEYQLMKNISDAQRLDWENQIHKAKDKETDFNITLDAKMTFQINITNDYITPKPILHIGQTLNPIFEMFTNTLILTTEILPCTFLESIGYTIYEEVISNKLKKQIETKTEEAEIVILNNINTTSKNTNKMKKHIKKIKEENSNTHIIGKKKLGCDDTFESIKGSNKLLKDKNINSLHIITSPKHPNEIFDYFVEFKKNKNNLLINFPNNFMRLLVEQKCIDDINQASARIFGLRKLRHNKKNIKINYFVTNYDKINLNAILKSRYIPKSINYTTKFLN